MKSYLKHFLCFSFAVVLLLAGQACKKPVTATGTDPRVQDSIMRADSIRRADSLANDSNTVRSSYLLEKHYWREVSTAPPYGPDTGGVITDSVVGVYTIHVVGSGDSIVIDGQLFQRWFNAPPDSVGYFGDGGVDRATFYAGRDSLHWVDMLTYSGHSYNASAYFYYGHAIH